jgi:hypothetical protein
MLSNLWYVRGWGGYDSEARGFRWQFDVEDWAAKVSQIEGVRSFKFSSPWNVVYNTNSRSIANEMNPVIRRLRPSCRSLGVWSKTAHTIDLLSMLIEQSRPSLCLGERSRLLTQWWPRNSPPSQLQMATSIRMQKPITLWQRPMRLRLPQMRHQNLCGDQLRPHCHIFRETRTKYDRYCRDISSSFN